MTRGLSAKRRAAEHASRETLPARAARRVPFDILRRHAMQKLEWQTPAAIDWRFGFEITLYVAAR